MSENCTAVFVYGTLKRGEVREGCWLRRPLLVEAATVRGAIYDLEAYPALLRGDDLVAGELWRFAEWDMEATLVGLDEVEGFCGDDGDEYRRVVVECETGGGMVAAWAYVYARADVLQSEQRIRPDGRGLCSWRGRNSS